MTKRIIGLILVVALITSSQVPSLSVFADDNAISDLDYANKLMEIGVFKGTANGFELDRAPTRLEGLIMLVRLLGKSGEADNQVWPDSGFNDVPEWAKNTVNFAKATKLTNGISDDKFGSNIVLSYRDYATFLLRALQLSEQSSWQTAEHDIVRLTVITQSDIPKETFLRGDVARLSYKALISKTSSGQLLINKLVAENAIDKKTAESILNSQLAQLVILEDSDNPISQNPSDQNSNNPTTADDTTNQQAVDKRAADNNATENKPSTIDANNEIERELFDLVNVVRQEHGLDPFKPASSEINAYADLRANEIIDKFSHTRPNGVSSLDYFQNVSTAGENVAAGQKTAQAVLEDWLDSPGHKANILNADYKYMALGYKSNNWVQLFYTPFDDE